MRPRLRSLGRTPFEWPATIARVLGTARDARRPIYAAVPRDIARAGDGAGHLPRFATKGGTRHNDSSRVAKTTSKLMGKTTTSDDGDRSVPA